MLTHRSLRETLAYNPDSGVFTWLRPTGTQKYARLGKVAGTRSHGYICIRIRGEAFLAHRLAWFYVHGEWPDQIDHVNGDRADNRIANLRSVSARVNSENMRGPMSNNKSGYLGVSMHPCGRYVAYIRVNGVKRFLGLYDDPQEASRVYLAAKRLAHEGCTI